MSQELAKRLCSFALALVIVSTAVAQVGYVPGGGGQPYYGSNGYGGGYGYSYNTAGAGSTPAGSYMTGMANAIRAQGQYNLATSEATVNLQEAQKRAIDNQTRWTNAYFEMRKVNQAYVDSQKKPPTSPETWVRLAHAAAPQRLSNDALDPITGRITWPSALQGKDFQADREVIEPLFIDRATMHGAIGVDMYDSIRKATDDMLARLKKHIRDINTSYYLEARNFLESLAHEANFAAQELASPQPAS